MFHGIADSVRQYKASIIPILLNTTKSQIPKKCQEAESPKIRDWIFRVNEIQNLECYDDRGAEVDEGTERKDKWEKWQAFKKHGDTLTRLHVYFNFKGVKSGRIIG